MKAKKLMAEHTTGVSRRELIRSVTAVGLAVAGGPLAMAASAPPPVCYGVGDGKVPLKPETIFPLLAAWLLLTTNGPFVLDEGTISCAANLHPDCAKKIKKYYDEDPNAFKPVRTKFERLAKEFSAGDLHPFYSGGQCPKDPDTVTPIAALFGSPTVALCKK